MLSHCRRNLSTISLSSLNESMITKLFCLNALSSGKLKDSKNLIGKKLYLPNSTINTGTNNKLIQALSKLSQSKSIGMTIEEKDCDIAIIIDTHKNKSNIKEAWRSLKHSGSLIVVSDPSSSNDNDMMTTYSFPVGLAIFKNLSLHGFSGNCGMNINKNDLDLLKDSDISDKEFTNIIHKSTLDQMQMQMISSV